MPAVLDPTNLYSETAGRQAQPRRQGRAAAGLCSQPRAELRVGDRSRDVAGRRHLQGRPQSAACRAVVGPQDAVGRQQRRGSHRRQPDADRSPDRQAGRRDRGRRSLQRLLVARRQVRDHRRRGAEAARLPQSADDEDARFAIADAALRRHQPRRLLDRRQLRALHLRVRRRRDQDRPGQPRRARHLDADARSTSGPTWWPSSPRFEKKKSQLDHRRSRSSCRRRPSSAARSAPRAACRRTSASRPTARPSSWPTCWPTACTWSTAHRSSRSASFRPASARTASIPAATANTSMSPTAAPTR